jgi:hypothetical protein
MLTKPHLLSRAARSNSTCGPLGIAGPNDIRSLRHPNENTGSRIRRLSNELGS